MAYDEDPEIPDWVEEFAKEQERKHLDKIKDNPEKLAAYRRELEEHDAMLDYFEDRATEAQEPLRSAGDDREDWEQYDGHKEDNLF